MNFTACRLLRVHRFGGNVAAMPTTTEDGLLRIGRAARILDVSVDTMRNWDRDGKLRAVRTTGNQRRYRREDIEALAAEAQRVAS